MHPAADVPDNSSSEDDDVLFDYVETGGPSLLNYEDFLLTTPLIQAIRANDVQAATSYIRSGKFLRGTDNRAWTPLHHAVHQQNMEIINLLLQSPDVDKDAIDYTGVSPLYLAAENASDAIVMRFLEEGCNVNITNSCYEMPLHVAVRRPSILVAHELLKKGAEINARALGGFTPLHEAVECNKLESVCMLLYYGADVNICCSSGLTPFMRAVNDISRLKIARTLFEYYNDFSTVSNDDGYTALLLAANSLSPIAIDIIKAGADVNWIPLDKKTLLFFSLYYPDANLFNEVWCRMDFQNFLCYCEIFLVNFIDECKFSTEEWVQCMYLILDSSIISELIDKCLMDTKKWDGIFFQNLTMSFYRRQVPLNDRVAIIISFLSYGVQVSLGEIDSTAALYGVNEEVEMFINCAHITLCNQGGLYFPFSLFVLGLDDDRVNSVLRLFIKSLDLFQFSSFNRDLRKTSILLAFGFFSFPFHTKQRIIKSSRPFPDLHEAVTERLNEIPEVPTLVELTRNQIRRAIKRNNQTNKSYKFYNAINKQTNKLYEFYKTVNDLPLPKRLKNILLFKELLYP